MATRRRDIAPRKDEIGPSLSHTSTTCLKATSSFPSKTISPQNHNPIAPRKSITTSLKPTIRTSANDVFKQHVMKKPTSTDTPHRPPQKTRVSTDPSLRPRGETPLQSQKRHVSTHPSRDKTPLPEQKGHISTNRSIRDKTPWPEQKGHISMNPYIRDKTPLREQKRHISTNPSIRDKTPFPDQKRPVSTNPSLRDKTPLPARKTHVSTSPSIRDKTPLPDHERHVSTNPFVRDKTPLPTRKTHVSTNPSHRSRHKTTLPAQKRHVSTNPSIRDKTPSRKTQVSTNPSVSRDKTPLPARETHISTSTTPLHRSFSISGKTTTCQKMGPSKNREALDKDVGEHNSLHRTPISTTLNTNNNMRSKEQVTEKTTTSPTKGQISDTFQENVEKPNKYQDAPEVEILPEDQESCTVVENEEQIVKVVSTDENDIVGLVPDTQEKSFDIVQIEIENDNKDEDDDDNDGKDVTFVANASSPVLEHQESEEKSYIQEEFEENGVHETDNTRSIADDCPKEEDEDKEVEVIEEEEVLDKKDEVCSESEAIKPIVVEEQKQVSGNAAQKQGGKKDYVVSNDVIEETANKLRDQTKNRVRALAGAFETVISLQ
ncbi:hypothetical protein OROGR_010733 [Orobanche gracilis]